MQQREFREFSALILTTSSQCYRQEITEDTVAIYFEALDSWPIDVVRDAVKAHVLDPDRGRFFPTIADLVAKIRAVTERRNERARQAASDRWLPPPPDAAERDPASWLPADPIAASQAVWSSILRSLGCRMRAEDAPPVLDPDHADRALNECGAFENGYPVGWSRMFRHEPGTTPLSDWAVRYAKPFRQAYCRHYGVELGDTAETYQRRSRRNAA